MKAHALITGEDGKQSIEEVIVPEPADNEIEVKTLFSGVSIGTEFALIRNKISWGPYPLCTGYMGTGIVEKAGKSVAGIAEGDTVYFRGCRAMTLADGSPVSCVSGAHCSRVVLDPGTTHGAERLPDGADPATASMFVMPAVGLYGVDMANPRMGETVVVYGCGLIGLGVIAACVHRGCRVIAVDVNAKRLAIARMFGADYLIDGSKESAADRVMELSPGGADTVFECTGLPSQIDPAIALCRSFGSFVWQGNYGADPVSMHFLPAHGRRLTMFFPCDDGLQPCRRAVIRNIAMGALRWEECITHRIGYREAPDVYGRIGAGKTDILGVVIDWNEG